MATRARSDAHVLVEALHRELAPVERLIRSHGYLDALSERRVPESSLRAFAGEQYSIIMSDRRSFAYLAARFPEPPAGDFFLALAEGEGEALSLLVRFADSLGLDEERLRAHEPEAGSQAYTAFVAWLALNGSRCAVALAFLANLAAWGENCARMAEALCGRYGLDAEAVAFFHFFAAPSSDFERRALAVIEAGLRAGESPEEARRAARLLQRYELLYWDTLAEGL